MKTKIFSKNHRCIVTLICLTLLITSCSSVDSFKRKELVNIHKNISGNFTNSTLSENGRTTKITKFFDLKDSDSIVQIQSKRNTIFVCFFDVLGGKHYKTFEGKFKRKFFQFYLDYDTNLYPPIFITTHKNRVRLSINQDSSLVVNNYYDNSGMLLIMGAGTSWNSKYIFNKR
ncbi:hypothetical protein OX283_000190 [Flavobacterium sp. SUN052]|uniref:hypothetical protein n=1 Tax=Flavobacterium sp. SUN052 TaxID=3002441 RepID=UPI00237D9245|nr:hypothetical protein [Flavobacterium sp. SUN052]MEC4003062.1 hypothetical protein [Flavobacterium sp. SUN052]